MSKIYKIKNISKDRWLIFVNDVYDDDNKAMIIRKSTRKGKKYDVYQVKYDADKKYTLLKILSFGSASHQQYKDKLKAYSHLDHNNKKRRANYYARHGKHNDDVFTAKFYAHELLW